MDEFCQCVDCADQDQGCSFDCDAGEECLGCHEARIEAAERFHDIACAQGVR